MSRCQPMFIFLMEVEINREKVEKVQRRLRFDGLFFVEGVNVGGGLALIWKEQSLVRLISYAKNYIDVVIHLQGMSIWRLPSFYGLLERNRRRESWNLIKSLKHK